MKIRLSALLIVSFVCSLCSLTTAEETPPARVAESSPKPASAEKPFIIYHIRKSCPVILDDEYGVMLINEGGDEEPSPRFIIAIKSSRTLIDTTDPKIAAIALTIIPKGSRIRRYDSCTVSRAYRLPESIGNEFSSAIKKASLTMFEWPNLTCYCESE